MGHVPTAQNINKMKLYVNSVMKSVMSNQTNNNQNLISEISYFDWFLEPIERTTEIDFYRFGRFCFFLIHPERPGPSSKSKTFHVAHSSRSSHCC